MTDGYASFAEHWKQVSASGICMVKQVRNAIIVSQQRWERAVLLQTTPLSLQHAWHVFLANHMNAGMTHSDENKLVEKIDQYTLQRNYAVKIINPHFEETQKIRTPSYNNYYNISGTGHSIYPWFWQTMTQCILQFCHFAPGHQQSIE